MARLGLKDAFAKYGAKLRNVQWSVSAWAPDGALVVSLWAHHCRKGPHGSIEYADSASRWSGPGNAEFRENVAKAFRQKSPVRLVVATAQNTEHVEAGKDASKVKKDFAVREDLMGEVAAYDGDKFVFRFVRNSAYKIATLLKALSELLWTVLRVWLKLMVVLIGAFVGLVAALAWKK